MAELPKEFDPFGEPGFFIAKQPNPSVGSA
jgi:hypothetical protein